jgi:hypothetical protein
VEDPSGGAEPVLVLEAQVHLLGRRRDHLEAEGLGQGHRRMCLRSQLGVRTGHAGTLVPSTLGV